jgi:hypothetical protein
MNGVVNADSIRGHLLTPTQARAIEQHTRFLRKIADKAAGLEPSVPHAPEPDPPSLTIALIQRRTCKAFKIEFPELLSPRRNRRVVAARQVAMYLCKKLTSHSLVVIGQKSGRMDHSTVLHACGRIETILALPAGSGLSIQCPAHFCDMVRARTAVLFDELVAQFPSVKSET